MKLVTERRTRPILITYGLGGKAIAIGRYHSYSGPSKNQGIEAYRRITGGRISGAGEGWVGLCLVMPYLGAVLSEDGRALKPEQAINRYSRGILRGLRAIGVDCFYPGRDTITISRRQFAVCSFELDASGALLFESLIALARGFEELAIDLDRFDPQGRLTCALYDSNSATTLNRETGRCLTFAEIADTIEHGCELEWGQLNRRELTEQEDRISESNRPPLTLEWPPTEPTHTIRELLSRMPSQLGFVEARVGLDGNGKVERALLTGDFIASSGAVDAFGRALRGSPLTPESINRAVMRSFEGGAGFILGVGELSNLVSLIAKAA